MSQKQKLKQKSKKDNMITGCLNFIWGNLQAQI